MWDPVSKTKMKSSWGRQLTSTSGLQNPSPTPIVNKTNKCFKAVMSLLATQQCSYHIHLKQDDISHMIFVIQVSVLVDLWWQHWASHAGNLRAVYVLHFLGAPCSQPIHWRVFQCHLQVFSWTYQFPDILSATLKLQLSPYQFPPPYATCPALPRPQVAGLSFVQPILPTRTLCTGTNVMPYHPNGSYGLWQSHREGKRQDEVSKGPSVRLDTSPSSLTMSHGSHTNFIGYKLKTKQLFLSHHTLTRDLWLPASIK